MDRPRSGDEYVHFFALLLLLMALFDRLFVTALLHFLLLEQLLAVGLLLGLVTELLE